MANKKIIPPNRRDLLTTRSREPTQRAANFFEELTRQIPPIADLTGTPTNIELRDKINEILTGLRDKGLLEA